MKTGKNHFDAPSDNKCFEIKQKTHDSILLSSLVAQESIKQEQRVSCFVKVINLTSTSFQFWCQQPIWMCSNFSRSPVSSKYVTRDYGSVIPSTALTLWKVSNFNESIHWSNIWLSVVTFNPTVPTFSPWRQSFDGKKTWRLPTIFPS